LFDAADAVVQRPLGMAGIAGHSQRKESAWLACRRSASAIPKAGKRQKPAPLTFLRNTIQELDRPAPAPRYSPCSPGWRTPVKSAVIRRTACLGSPSNP
jgi:hypothetical protein